MAPCKMELLSLVEVRSFLPVEFCTISGNNSTAEYYENELILSIVFYNVMVYHTTRA